MRYLLQRLFNRCKQKSLPNYCKHFSSFSKGLKMNRLIDERANLLKEVNNWTVKREFCDVDTATSEFVRCEIIGGSRTDTKFLHTFNDDQLFTATDFGRYGRIYRCKNRKCPARLVLTPSGRSYRLKKNKKHNHTDNCAQDVINLKALNQMKGKCSDLKEVANGRRITKIKDIFTEVMTK